uniref:Secreted protein n=1 Tax=Macrostomum lignano TaxID=282301 RepID=A0A1I8HMK5_9PLAT
MAAASTSIWARAAPASRLRKTMATRFITRCAKPACQRRASTPAAVGSGRRCSTCASPPEVSWPCSCSPAAAAAAARLAGRTAPSTDRPAMSWSLGPAMMLRCCRP